MNDAIYYFRFHQEVQTSNSNASHFQSIIICSRDDIVTKFTSDNKGMEPERVQTEVDKFMMDR